jgi:hypothetical protein
MNHKLVFLYENVRISSQISFACSIVMGSEQFIHEGIHGWHFGDDDVDL